MRLIEAGRAGHGLSGGADAPIALGIVKGFILMKILTDSWNHAEKGSRPFSVDRDGFVLAEGAWMFVLRNMSMPGPAARMCWQKSADTVRLVRRFTACASRVRRGTSPGNRAGHEAGRH